MLRPTPATLAIVLALGAPLALPGASAADSGGAPPSGGAAPGTTATIAPSASSAVASAAGSNGVTLTARTGAIVRTTQRFRGTVSGGSGKTVAVQLLAPTGDWSTVAQTTVAADGSFVARWRADHLGRYQARALVLGPGGSASAAGTPPVITVTVHHQATATWYGPGFYGKKTACGIQLTHQTLGVAHRRLPCGTQVSVLYKGKTIVVPVIDRGPFANGADWDLTAATAQALGITETAQIGELALRGGRAPAV
jgi:rare lipoprotein A